MAIVARMACDEGAVEKVSDIGVDVTIGRRVLRWTIFVAQAFKGKEPVLGTFQWRQCRARADEGTVEGIAAKCELEDENRQGPAIRIRVTLRRQLAPNSRLPAALVPGTPRERGYRDRADRPR